VIVLVLGGASSGKSALAERLAATRLAPPVTYVATGSATDEDMAARIAAHQSRRPASWSTVESGADLPGAVRGLGGSLLVDSLGTWVAGTWVAGVDGMAADGQALAAALAGREGDAVVVSDEVGLGVHPSTLVGRAFREALGQVNQAVAAVADEVLLVVAGRVLPLSPAAFPTERV
jgi:adenosyl cobinamide kinase/adenosyl cobinamide phosphate guanylyltransferase